MCMVDMGKDWPWYVMFRARRWAFKASGGSFDLFEHVVMAHLVISNFIEAPLEKTNKLPILGCTWIFHGLRCHA